MTEVDAGLAGRPSVITTPVPLVAAPADGSTWLRRWGAELAVAVATGVVDSWRLSQNGYGNPFYAASVRSMDLNFHNFGFASFDPGGWITVDKPPLAQWLDATSVRIFGFSSWSLLMPSVLCSVLAVWLLMAAVRRPWGRAAGLVAGLALASTPIALAVARSNNPDALLVLCCVAAAWAGQRAMDGHGLRWMIVAGLLGGLAFLAKLLVVGAVLPAVWLAYLVGAPRPRLRIRVLHCLAGAVVFVAVAGAWVGAVDLTPLSHRPWIGGSTDGSALNLVFGYNGVARLSGSGTGQIGAFSRGGLFTNSLGINEFGGPPGIGRLFNRGLGDQAMWLAPLAVAALLGALAVAVRHRRRDARFGSAVLWGSWAVTTYVTLALADGTFHNYYVALLSPALAALVGLGVRLVAEAGWLGRSVAALSLAATAAAEVVLLDRVQAWAGLRRIVPLAVTLAVVALVAAAPWERTRRPLALGALSVGLLAVGVPPGVWTLSGVRHPESGGEPEARPDMADAVPAAVTTILAGRRLPGPEVRWLEREQHGERWLVGVGDAGGAELDIIDGRSVVALGGFLGTDPSDSVARVAAAVAAGRLRFVIPGGTMPGADGATSAAVAAACTRVDPSRWLGPHPTGAPGAPPLYDCQGRAAAMRAFATRPAQASAPAAARGDPSRPRPEPERRAGIGPEPWSRPLRTVRGS